MSVSLIAAKQSEKLLQFLLFSTTCTATAGNKANDSVGAMQSPFCCMRVSGFLISFCLSLVQCSIYFPINHVKKAIFKVKDGVLETQQHWVCVCCNEGLMKAQCVCVYRRGHFVHCPSGCFLCVYNVSIHLYDARFASFCLHVVGRGRISCWLLHQCLFCCNKG